MKRILYCILVVSFAGASPLVAEEQEVFEAIPNEYIVSVSNVNVLRARAVEALESITNEDLAIIDQNSHVILVGEAGAGRGTPEEAAQEDPMEGLPDDLREEQRELRRQSRMKALSISESRILTLRVTKNFVLHASATPDDSYLSLTWGMDQANDVDIDASNAWDRSTGAASVVVGIIDTGIDYNHPDLSANIWTNPGEIPGNGQDDDGNGYIDDVRGLNAITYTSSNRLAGDPMDDNGHGSHVAGTIGAVGNNARGVAGVNWRVTMIPIKFLSSSGSGSLMDAIEAVDYATALKRKGIPIVLTNNSWGGGPYIQELVDAITRNRDEGILFVAAAGNNSQNLDNSPSYPASYTVPNIVSVGAMDSNGAPASFSNFGAASVDIAAPGVRIASTYPGNRYVYLDGTSMAAPHVSGALALLKAYSYGLDWQTMINVLYASADIRTSLQGKFYANRSLNVDKMLQSVTSNPAPPTLSYPTPTPTVPPPTATPTPSPTATPTVPPGNFDLTGRALVNGTPVQGARVQLSVGGTQSARLTNTDGLFRFDDVPGPVSYSLTTTKSGLTFPALTGTLLRDTSLTVNAQSRTHSLTVRVQSPAKVPLAGVVVDAGPYGRVTTDGQGVATFTVVHGALYSLAPSSTAYTFPQGTLQGDLLGPSTRVITGRLVSAP